MKKYFIAVAALALLAACSGKKTAEPALIEEDVYAIDEAAPGAPAYRNRESCQTGQYA